MEFNRFLLVAQNSVEHLKLSKSICRCPSGRGSDMATHHSSPASDQKTDKPQNVLPVFRSLKNFRFLFRRHKVLTPQNKAMSRAPDHKAVHDAELQNLGPAKVEAILNGSKQLTAISLSSELKELGQLLAPSGFRSLILSSSVGPSSPAHSVTLRATRHHFLIEKIQVQFQVAP
jgi:hypothetical protein